MSLFTSVILSNTTQCAVRRALFCYFFFVGLTFSSWASRIPEIKSFYNMNDSQWGLMLLMIPLGQVAGMSFSGPFTSRVGSNRVLLVAILGYSLSLVGIGSSTVLPLFVTSLVGFGFFGNFCNIALNTQAVIAENFYCRPIMSSFHGGWSLAGLVGAIFGLAMSVLGVEVWFHFSLVALLIILGSLLLYKYLQYDAINNFVVEQSGERESKVPFEKFLLWLGIIGFVGWATEGTIADWNGIYLNQVVGIENKYTPIGLALYMVTMTIGRFLMDNVTARFGRRGVLTFSGCAIFVGMFITVLLPYLWWVLIGYMIVGFGASGVIPALYSAAGEKSKMAPSKSITIVATISFAGFLLGPPLIGYISQLSSLRHAFAIVGSLGLLAWIISYKLSILKK